MTQNDWTYARAGVDIEQKSRSIASLVNKLTYRRTGRGRVIDIKGQFTSLIDFDGTVLTLCTDGVGTKLLIAEALDKWDTVGIDCMAMNVNDTICVGAEPFAFVDYIAIDRPDERITEQIGIGLERAAEECNVDIVGGEIAVLPEIVRGVDLSGTALGWLEKEKIVDGSKVRIGDAIIGLRSSGIHSNGMTLARKVLESVEMNLDEKFDRLGKTIGQELLTPTELYVKKVVELVDKVSIHGMVDVTGGGLKNFVRLKKDVLFEITEPIGPQPVFEIISELGHVSPTEMYKTFNMGMGYGIVLPQESVKEALHVLGEGAKVIGQVAQGNGVGIPSLGELLDVKLVENLTADEILLRLRAVSPPGIEFLAAAALADGDPPLGRVLTEARYVVRLPDGRSASAAESLWNAGEPLLATRRERSDSRRPDRGNTVDVRKSITFAKVPEPEARDLLVEKLAWPAEEHDRILVFGLVISAFGSARPVEVIEAFFGEGAPAGCEIVRMGLYATAGGEKVDPVEVEKLRAEKLTTENTENTEGTVQSEEPI